MNVKPKYLVSACLAGEKCRYDGRSLKDKKIVQLVRKGLAIPVCPEKLGGLPIPRPKAEIEKGDGKDVVSKKSKVITQEGADITSQMIKGAKKTLRIAQTYRIKKAFMKNKSPSCSCGKIYRKGRLIKGEGVTVALLKEKNIKIIPK